MPYFEVKGIGKGKGTLMKKASEEWEKMSEENKGKYKKISEDLSLKHQYLLKLVHNLKKIGKVVEPTALNYYMFDKKELIPSEELNYINEYDYLINLWNRESETVKEYYKAKEHKETQINKEKENAAKNKITKYENDIIHEFKRPELKCLRPKINSNYFNDDSDESEETKGVESGRFNYIMTKMTEFLLSLKKEGKNNINYMDIYKGLTDKWNLMDDSEKINWKE